MRFTVEVVRDDVEQHCREARAELRDVKAIMRGIAQEAATLERQSHAYQNRTGDLERSTMVRDFGGQYLDTFIGVSVEMGEEYASHVVKLGYSAFPVTVEKAGQQIGGALVAMSERIAK